MNPVSSGYHFFDSQADSGIRKRISGSLDNLSDSDNVYGMKKKWKNYSKALKMELKQNRKSFIVYMILRILVIATIIGQFLRGNYENVFLSIMTLFLLMLPSILQMELKIELPTLLEIIILCFIFAAEILGEIHSFYLVIPNWDTVLHTMNGFLCAGIGFSLVTILNQNQKLQFQLSPVFVCLVAFCFSMTVGVLWEFVEFGLDKYMGTDCQKDTIVHEIRSVDLRDDQVNVPVVITDIHDVMVNGERLPIDGYLDIGLIDTMGDLFVNFIGATVFCFAGYFYLAYDRKNSGRFVAQFVPRTKEEENDFKKLVLESNKD